MHPHAVIWPWLASSFVLITVGCGNAPTDPDQREERVIVPEIVALSGLDDQYVTAELPVTLRRQRGDSALLEYCGLRPVVVVQEMVESGEWETASDYFCPDEDLSIGAKVGPSVESFVVPVTVRLNGRDVTDLRLRALVKVSLDGTRPSFEASVFASQTSGIAG